MSKPATEYGILTTEPPEHSFPTGSPWSAEAYRAAMSAAVEAVISNFSHRPYSGASPDELAGLFGSEGPCPEEGADLAEILRRVGDEVVGHSGGVAHPKCAAHLHCPPLLPALAAEAIISATNQSLDSWDQSPAATMLERRMVRWLCELFGFEDSGDGVFTSGGTHSNFMALLLARDRYARDNLGLSVRVEGLSPETRRFRILCSEAAHFTVSQSAALLGLGEKSVVPVATDECFRMSPEALDKRLRELRDRELLPIALVGTAGTTDFGSIDPLPELADRARREGMWFHVDAAYGGALAMSEKHQHKLNGIEAADSVAADFHKNFYQPISCAALLVREESSFELLETHADYLNPESDEDSGVPNLVGKSVQTSRRFDALKLYISLRALGRGNFAAMIEHTLDVAAETANLIAEDPELELVNRPEMSAVVFRYRPGDMTEERANEVNGGIWTSLVRSGAVMLARTKVGGREHLKFTLLNPLTTTEHTAEILQLVKKLGRERGEGA